MNSELKGTKFIFIYRQMQLNTFCNIIVFARFSPYEIRMFHNAKYSLIQ
jgi:hypothetical protein